MSERIQKLLEAVQTMHGCTAKHTHSVPCKEVFRGQTVWEGVVECFTLTGHPKAQRAYAWSFHDGKEDQFVAVLEIPPVISPLTAVKAYVASPGTK